MPIKKSAKKAAKQAVKKRTVNVEFKDLMKSAIKAVKKAIDAKSSDVAELMVYAQKRIDKASKRNIITKQSASRKKSTLMRTLQAEGVVTSSTTEKAPKKASSKKTSKETA